MTRICVICPRGCILSIECDREGAENQALEVSSSNVTLIVKGNHCPKGVEFAGQEWFKPMRLLTTTVKTTSERFPRIPVKTSGPIPKEQIFEVMQMINILTIQLPVSVGDVIVHNILNLGVDILSTLSIKED